MLQDNLSRPPRNSTISETVLFPFNGPPNRSLPPLEPSTPRPSSPNPSEYVGTPSPINPTSPSIPHSEQPPTLGSTNPPSTAQPQPTSPNLPTPQPKSHSTRISPAPPKSSPVSASYNQDPEVSRTSLQQAVPLQSSPSTPPSTNLFSPEDITSTLAHTGLEFKLAKLVSQTYLDRAVQLQLASQSRFAAAQRDIAPKPAPPRSSPVSASYNQAPEVSSTPEAT
ncbi:hypothetical protein FRC03_006380 [Tulasnella sp. 419]|nr:hypothetical protein FRC03_006380 [Tulasnella sp. 419]